MSGDLNALADRDFYDCTRCCVPGCDNPTSVGLCFSCEDWINGEVEQLETEARSRAQGDAA